MNSLTWVAIPVGLKTDRYPVVSVYVSIRLGPPAMSAASSTSPLSAYSDFRDWPATLRDNLSFELDFYDVQTGALLSKDTSPQIVSAPDSNVWTSLFPSDTPVKPRSVQDTDPRVNRTYESYSVRRYAEYINAAYLSLVDRSLQNLIAIQGQSDSTRGRLASMSRMPVARPTVREVREGFADSNLLLPQTPSEYDIFWVRSYISIFSAWVKEGGGGAPNTDDRMKVQAQVDFLTTRLSPAPLSSGNSRERWARFKHEAFAAVVVRAIRNVFGKDIDHGPPFPGRTTAQFGSTMSQQPRDRWSQRAISIDDHLQHALFHRQIPNDAGSQACRTERYEFHELVSMLGSHPVLYPSVGLVIDLVGSAEIPKSSKGTVSVTSRWKSRPKTIDELFPRTAYQLFSTPSDAKTAKQVPRLLLPLSRSEGSSQVQRQRDATKEDVISRGVLDLSDSSRFHLEIMDTHGDYYKASRLDDNGTTRSPEYLDPDAERPVPKLRSCGIALVRTNRQDQVQHSAEQISQQHQDDFAKNKTTTFYAEDLTTGYRVDVGVVPPGRDSDKPDWFSLCSRKTTFEHGGSSGGRFLELIPKESGNYFRVEGIVQSGATKPADAQGEEFQLLETIFRWENWSLSIPLPLKKKAGESPCEEIRKNPLKPLQLCPHHTLDGLLPPMRYGYSYYIRCRAAFLDGSGLKLEDCDNSASKIGDAAGKPLTFLRLESVDSPIVLLKDPYDPNEMPGEQMTRLILRGDGDRAQRFLVPARVSPHQAFLHGYFDDSRSGAFTNFRLNDDGTFITVQQLKRPEDFGDSANPKPPQNAAERNSIARPSESHPKNPYYPDPASRRCQVALIHRRSTGTQLKSWDFFAINSWPKAKPFVITLANSFTGQSQDAELYVDADNGFGVALKPGRTAKVSIVPLLLSDQLQPLAESHLFRFMGQTRDTIKARVKVDTSSSSAIIPELHWLFVAPREIELVHAVKQPLMAPYFKALSLESQEFGNPSVRLSGIAIADVDSTGDIEVSAVWTDRVDRPGTPKPDHQTSHVKLPKRELELAAFASAGEGTITHKFDHLFPDTKYHKITYSLSGTSRFAAYYKPGANSSNPQNAETAFSNADKTKDVTVYVCNRARPQQPTVLYLLPAFQWERVEVKRDRIHHRHCAVRVYLDRGWFNSSGDGELLGVLLKQEGSDIPPSAQSLVTQCGVDPLWKAPDKAPSVSMYPAVGDFQNVSPFVRTCIGKREDKKEDWESSLDGLSVDENPDVRVTAVGFRPEFDEARKLWHCEIDLSPAGTYFPFVRFALARFQPNSLDGAHLSKVVTADFAQIAPDRWSCVRWGKRTASVSVYGFTYQDSFSQQKGSEMVVRLEQRVSGMDEDTCWIPAVNKQGKEIVQTVSPQPFTVLECFPLLNAVPKELKAGIGLSVWKAELDLTGCSFATHRRVLIQEVERFKADDRTAGKTPSDTVDCQRVVFADVVGH